MKPTPIEHALRCTLIGAVLAFGLVRAGAALARDPSPDSQARQVMSGMPEMSAGDATPVLSDSGRANGEGFIIPDPDVTLFGFIPLHAACSGSEEPPRMWRHEISAAPHDEQSANSP